MSSGDPIPSAVRHWYECCGGFFDLSLGAYGCPDCCGDNKADLQSGVLPIDLNSEDRGNEWSEY